MATNPDRHATALWVIVGLGCVMGGLALGAILMPLPDMVAGIAKALFALMVLLALILIAIGVWRLSALPGQRPVLVPVIIGVAAVILAVGLGVWVAGTQSLDDPNPLKIVRVLGSGLGFAVVLGAVAYAAVRLVAPHRAVRDDLR
ncbi:MAG: hypothetical protein L0G99_15845 [Propionibacteriales bacterium]|nr:hypothetical protein [Propionibacteriales bacterium]